eukprot:CAMPEP_0117532322 /NCGR_PEP_ID=MMETSP0784-20121206/39308_1 /TAXON_ID=39447 /ORGANISM="" /LENGTH=163 /DNA_ID=CAMNT_0005328711 /DNA_START=938 /DNA_END=1429 /DNA_ORIENTATION=+
MASTSQNSRAKRPSFWSLALRPSPSSSEGGRRRHDARCGGDGGTSAEGNGRRHFGKGVLGERSKAVAGRWFWSSSSTDSLEFETISLQDTRGVNNRGGDNGAKQGVNPTPDAAAGGAGAGIAAVLARFQGGGCGGGSMGPRSLLRPWHGLGVGSRKDDSWNKA